MKVFIALIIALTLPVVSFASMSDPSWKGMSYLDVLKAPITQKEKPIVDFIKKKYDVTQEESERVVKAARGTGETIAMLAIMLTEFELGPQKDKYGIMHVSGRFIKNEPFKTKIKEECWIDTIKELDKGPLELNFCAANTALQILIKKHGGIEKGINVYGTGETESKYADAVYKNLEYLMKITGEGKN
jgi:hypothetical protein